MKPFHWTAYFCFRQTRAINPSSCQAVVRQSSGSFNKTVRQLSGSRQAVIRLWNLVTFSRRCLVRFTHLWYQIFPCSLLGSWHLPQIILRLGNHISDLWGQNWGQHSGFSEENYPKIGFFLKISKNAISCIWIQKLRLFLGWRGGKRSNQLFFVPEGLKKHHFYMTTL